VDEGTVINGSEPPRGETLGKSVDGVVADGPNEPLWRARLLTLRFDRQNLRIIRMQVLVVDKMQAHTENMPSKIYHRLLNLGKTGAIEDWPSHWD